MAPMTREALKGLIKECLIEILSEGVTSSGRSRPQETPKKTQTPASQPSIKRSKSIFDQLEEANRKQHVQKAGNLFSANPMSSAIKSATNDPILQSILSETAKTTLQDQIQHEQMIPRVPSYDPSSLYSQDTSTQRSNHIVESSENSDLNLGAAAGLDITSLFGNAVSNWEEVLQRSEKTRP